MLSQILAESDRLGENADLRHDFAMYPSTPNFTTASDNDAWWLIGYTGADGSRQVSVCSTGGRAFVDVLQMILGITQDGRWGTGTSNALVNALRATGASSTLIAGVQNEAAANRIGIGQLRGAVVLLHRGQSFGGDVPTSVDENSVAIDPNVIGPQWNVAAPPGPSGDILPTCASRDQAAGTAPVSTGTGTIPEVNVQVPPEGPATKPGSVPAPYVPSATPAPARSSTGWVLTGLGAIALIGAGAVAVMRNRGRTTGAARARKNPATKFDRARGEMLQELDWLARYPVQEHAGRLDWFRLATIDAGVDPRDLKYEYHLGESSGRYDTLIRRVESQVRNASNQQIAAYYEDYAGIPL